MKIKYLIISLLLVSLFSCGEGDSYDISKVTIFPTFEYEPTVVLQLGETYTPDGVAKEGDEVLETTVSGSVDENTVGVYAVVYSATNSDGYDGSATQTVFVYDPSITTDFSGTYTSSITRTESDGTDPRSYDGEVNITLVQPGIFYVDCLLGGTYSIHYGYGPAYAMTGYISAEADNSLHHLSSFVQGWGDGLEGLQNGLYNDVTGIPYWESIYANTDIYAITLTN